MPFAAFPSELNPEHRNKGILEIATNLDGGANERRPISSVGGGLSSEVTQIETLLLRLDAGRHALRQAANTLLLADVLAPLQLARLSDPKSSPRRFFTVDRNRFARLTPRRAAILCAESFLSIDLALACIFSQRLMATLVNVACVPSPQADELPSHAFDAFSAIDQADVQADTSELFSFEQFATEREQA